jgi:FG-GAP repeat
MKHKLLALAFAAGSSLHAQAAAPGESQTLTSPDQVPQGLTAADWSSIRRTLSAGYTANAAGVISQQAYLKASNTGGGDNFGNSVAVSGDTVVVGAPREDSSAVGVGVSPNETAYDSGAAYVFVRSGGTWTQQAYLKASNVGVDAGFGSSVAIAGEIIVVGANSEDSATSGVNNIPAGTATNSGAAYVFVRNGGTWTQQAYLKASNTEQYDRFGESVAVSGETIVVGALFEDSGSVGPGSPQNNNSGVDSGAAYVFTRSGVVWSQQAYFKSSNSQVGDQFGGSVAISGETIVVGAEEEDSSTLGVGSTPNESARRSGAAYVFTRSGLTWSEQAYLKASNTGAGDAFGYSVAVSGETIVVGAYLEDSSTTGVGSVPNEMASDSGAAYVFVRSAGIWSQQAYLKASNTVGNDLLGYAVAVSGDTVAVGASGEDSSTTGVGSTPNAAALGSGAAFVFTRSAGIWSQQAYLKASKSTVGDYFGISLGISGPSLIAGASLENSISTGVNSVPNEESVDFNSGAAYVFTLPVDGPPIVPPVVPPAVDKTAPVIRVARTNPVSTKAKTATFKGSASDASGIKSVQYRLGKGPRKFATGTTAWTFKTKLKKGLNILTLTATDTAGNVSTGKVIKIKRK